MLVSHPPQSETELLTRAESLAGIKLQDIAKQLQIPVPDNLNRIKGWVGELLESALGATASTLPEPDFQSLGIELKTIPVKNNGHPKESTFVCTVNLLEAHKSDWQNSIVKKKLHRVLWIPIEANSEIKLKDRRIGQALLWSPTEQQESILKSDWEEIMELISLGQLDTISTSIGQYLQIRPKAANAKSLCDAFDKEGNKIKTLPRGFYLRSLFTQQILQQHFHSIA